MKISGFTFAHNFIECGMPTIEAISAVRPYVDEIVAVDIESTDNTKEILHKLCEKVLTSSWGSRDTTPNAFLKNIHCSGDTIIFFEADEVYDDNLLKEVVRHIENGHHNLAVWRIQIEQNFQRCRQYPIPVHRIFPKGGGTYHIHPTIWPEFIRTEIKILSQEVGYLWDCSNIFREQWLQRKQAQSEIWGEPRHLMVAEHFTEHNEISEEEELKRLNEPYWEYTSTPFAIPLILKKLVGKTKYEVEL